ncbi:Pancreatic lipase-related protein 1 [Trachymyrmex septentrionalis]|uniref:phospholipase A1 n=1 Tax=Trachymyrmex septentrionalis TaxID=34720 RepID=A0A195EXE8_9HYME|nr:Pancreatic lipase-related protein 1 [Trachymyrmex septentrionalis]
MCLIIPLRNRETNPRALGRKLYLEAFTNRKNRLLCLDHSRDTILHLTLLPTGTCFYCCPIQLNRDVQFLLYTRRNPTYPNVLDFNDVTTLRKSNFNDKHPTIIYIHGYSDSSSGKGPTSIRNAYLRRGHYNVILINWPKLAVLPWYITAVRNAKVVGPYLAHMISWLDAQKAVPLSKIHVIGFSLGAEVAGFMGKALAPRKSANNDRDAISTRPTDYMLSVCVCVYLRNALRSPVEPMGATRQRAGSHSFPILTVKINGRRRRKLRPPWPFLSREPESAAETGLPGLRVLEKCPARCTLQAAYWYIYPDRSDSLAGKYFLLVNESGAPRVRRGHQPSFRNPNNVRDIPTSTPVREKVCSESDDSTRPCQPFCHRNGMVQLGAVEARHNPRIVLHPTPVQQLISKGKSYEAVCVSPWRVNPSGIKGQNRRNGGATLRPAVRHNGRHEKSVVPGLSRQAIGLRAFFVQEEKFLFSSSLSLSLCLSLENAIKWHDYLARLQDRCGKPKSFTMAPTIYPRLLSSMKGIRHKAEVWLSRESKQARTPFRSRSLSRGRERRDRKIATPESGDERTNEERERERADSLAYEESGVKEGMEKRFQVSIRGGSVFFRGLQSPRMSLTSNDYFSQLPLCGNAWRLTIAFVVQQPTWTAAAKTGCYRGNGSSWCKVSHEERPQSHACARVQNAHKKLMGAVPHCPAHREGDAKTGVKGRKGRRMLDLHEKIDGLEEGDACSVCSWPCLSSMHFDKTFFWGKHTVRSGT